MVFSFRITEPGYFIRSGLILLFIDVTCEAGFNAL